MPPTRRSHSLEQKYEGEVTVVTQNIDPLHEQAGSKRVIHMHGRDGEIRCMNCGTVTESDDDLSPASICPHCKAVGELRPNIVWFGEMPMHMDEIDAVLERCGLFLSIGTSGEVYPAAGFVMHVRRHNHRAHTVELNLEPTDNQTLFHRAHLRPRHAHRAALCRARAGERLEITRRKPCPT